MQKGTLLKISIQESMSSCTIPVLFVLKKDNTRHICIDYRATIKITVKYRHLIFRLDNMLDKLYGSFVFSKIGLKL
jgi:hypothetical protein